MQITDKVIRDTVTAQREDKRRRNISAMHRVHNAPAAARYAVKLDNGTDADVQALLALLAPFSATPLYRTEKIPG